jgi:predicted RNA binding protein YcfA (HicA-like mRNA interferase family)
MASLSTAELKRYLKAHGCYLVSNKGPHEKWYSPITHRKFSIPRDLKGETTLFKILEAAGLRHPKFGQ